jgi:hypothetical protein
MGYTHYYPHIRSITNEEWEKITAKVKQILAHRRCPKLWAEYDEEDTDPLIGATSIQFNGTGEELGHETFFLTKEDEGGFSFCKTARKPYDTAVTAVLSVVHTEAPNALDISSDGEASDWEKGVLLAAEATGDSVFCPIDDEYEEEDEDEDDDGDSEDED